MYFLEWLICFSSKKLEVDMMDQRSLHAALRTQTNKGELCVCGEGVCGAEGWDISNHLIENT